MNYQTMEELELENNMLSTEERWLQEALSKIKKQKLSLEVEQLQLNSILRTLEKQRDDDLNKQNISSTLNNTQNVSVVVNETNKVELIKVELLDEAKSSINTRTLDLSIMNDFNDIVSNMCFEDEEDEDD